MGSTPLSNDGAAAPHAIGIVGLGSISKTYLEALGDHPAVRITAVADLDRQRADAAAATSGARALSVDELLADSDVQTVLNLTIPAAHAEIALGAIAHGKNVYGEKPLAATVAEGRAVMTAARSAGVWVGSAPDTVLGTGVQTARAAIDAGRIGRPTSALATLVVPGHERWHPAPDFYYQRGGGPLFDMGPYYLTALVQMLGRVSSVTGSASRTRSQRVIASGPRAGDTIAVDVATHIAGTLEHASGAITTLTMSFDGVRTEARPIEVHGEEGSLLVPDPNGFGGEVRLARLSKATGWDTNGWELLPDAGGYTDGSRGAGLVDFIAGERRASGDLALHVLEIMESVVRAAEEGRRITIESAPERPAPVPLSRWRG